MGREGAVLMHSYVEVCGFAQCHEELKPEPLSQTSPWFIFADLLPFIERHTMFKQLLTIIIGLVSIQKSCRWIYVISHVCLAGHCPVGWLALHEEK